MKSMDISKALKNSIIVVSGLPRSGTSMMMQILEAGGLEILSDNKRKPDTSNPKGYYELEAVKKLNIDNSVIKEAPGKVIKIITHLLEHLPMDYNYKIIFMKRNIEEIMRSQQKMLGEEEEDYPTEMIEIFKKELNNVEIWIQDNPNIEMIKINYSDMIHDPSENIHLIKEFLGVPLNEKKMLKVIDPSLYRSKTNK